MTIFAVKGGLASFRAWGNIAVAEHAMLAN